MFHHANRWLSLAVTVYDPYGLRYFDRPFGPREKQSMEGFSYGIETHNKRLESMFLRDYFYLLSGIEEKWGEQATHLIGQHTFDHCLSYGVAAKPFMAPSAFVNNYCVTLTNSEIDFVSECVRRGSNPSSRFAPKPIPKPKTKPINLIAAVGAIKYEHVK